MTEPGANILSASRFIPKDKKPAISPRSRRTSLQVHVSPSVGGRQGSIGNPSSKATAKQHLSKDNLSRSQLGSLLLSEINPSSTLQALSSVFSSTVSKPGVSVSGSPPEWSLVGSHVINSSIEVMPSSSGASSLREPVTASSFDSHMATVSAGTSYQHSLEPASTSFVDERPLAPPVFS